MGVQARCPQLKCGRVVPVDFFKRLCDEARQRKYEEWYIRSYVDDNPSVKWCTNPAGCPYACEYQGVDHCDIRCHCTFVWCWACGEEAHRPAQCSTVNLWNIKNSAESENISWIRANTKKCPKCHKPIEKNQGCNHMICSKAGGFALVSGLHMVHPPAGTISATSMTSKPRRVSTLRRRQHGKRPSTPWTSTSSMLSGSWTMTVA